MKAKIILDNYPPYLKPNKLYQIKGQSQIDPNIYFVITDDGSTTSLTSQIFRWNKRRNFRKVIKL